MARDDDLLELAVDRRDALRALATEPKHRRELQSALSVSKTTCHRIVRTFDERGLVRRTDDGYALTLFGRVVAEYTGRLADEMRTANQLRPLLDLFDPADSAADPDVFADPTVEWAVEASDTYAIDRGLERVRDTELLRVLDWTPVPDLYHERILTHLAENGARVESIYPRAEVAARLERFPELHDDLLEAGARPRYWVYEDVPDWGLSIYDDDLVELRAYEPQSGGYVLDAVSESDAALAWALDVFAAYRDRARPLTDIEGLPDWGDYTW